MLFVLKNYCAKLVGSLANPSLPSLAIAEFLENGGYDHHLRTIHHQHAEQVQYIIELFEQHFPTGTGFTRPCGGQVVWVELPGDIDIVEMFHDALREGICIAPGAMFSAKGKYRSFMRL